MTTLLLTHYCRDCCHQWPGHRIPCDLHEPYAFQGPGYGGCADHELAEDDEQQDDAGLWWLAGVSVLVFWAVVALLVIWLWQRGL